MTTATAPQTDVDRVREFARTTASHVHVSVGESFTVHTRTWGESEARDCVVSVDHISYDGENVVIRTESEGYDFGTVKFPYGTDVTLDTVAEAVRRWG